MIKRSLLIFAFTLVAVIGPMTAARACSCMAPDAAAFLAESDFVFAGSLVERPVGWGEEVDLGPDNVAYTFEVDAVYKGDIRDKTVEVWSALGGAACGFEMPIGEPVAIAASFSGGQLTGGLCATFGVDRLEAAAIDAGIEPVVPDDAAASPDEAIEEPSDDASISLVAVGAGIVVAVVVGVLGFAVVRRSQPDRT